MTRPTFTACLIAITLAVSSVAAQSAQLSFAHYAPGAGQIRLQVGEQTAETLKYSDFSTLHTYAGGMYRLRAVRTDGSVVAEGELVLANNDRFVVMLAGNGSSTAPYQLRKSIDHNHPFIGQHMSLQRANLAIVGGVGNQPADPMNITSSCPGASSARASDESFGYGTDPLDQRGWPSNLSISTGASDCVESASFPGFTTAVDATLNTKPGERYRRFVIGDGVIEPYEIVMVLQEREKILPVLTPSADIEGLWYPVGEANTGLQVAYDASAPEGRRVSAALFGYDVHGRSTWRILSPDRAGFLSVLEYRGGNPEGTQAAIPFQLGTAQLFMHSCTEMTLLPSGVITTNGDDVFGQVPREAMRLHKLFPPGCGGQAPQTPAGLGEGDAR